MRPLCGIKTIQGAAELTVFSAVLPAFVYCINILIQGQMFNSMSESGGTVYTLMAVVTTGGIVLLWIAVRTLKKCFVCIWTLMLL